MRIQTGVVALCILELTASSCGAGQLAASPEAPALAPSSIASPTPFTLNPNMTGSPLFIEAKSPKVVPPQAAVSRTRWVKIERGVLLDPQGRPLKLPPNAEITLNLFPDTTYIGVIEQVQQQGGGYAWVGHLKGVKTSTLLIVYTAGVFMGHFGSPGGVYEVSNAGGDLYQIIQIDQGKLPGGEGDLNIHARTI